MASALDRLRCRFGWWLLLLAAIVVPDGTKALDGFLAAGQAILDSMKAPK